jgi:hypothetical protein
MTTAECPGHGKGRVGKTSDHVWENTTISAATTLTRSRYNDKPGGIFEVMLLFLVSLIVDWGGLHWRELNHTVVFDSTEQ